MNRIIEYILIYLKGIFMGIADLIPGISGGTIAFIVGIYQRLISAISKISHKSIWNLFKSLYNRDFNRTYEIIEYLDLKFLITLFLGIFTSIILFSNIILFLFNNFLGYLIIFFVGLILASLYFIYKEIEYKSNFNLMFSLGGFLLGISLVYLVPINVEIPSIFYIILSGFLAIFALFLPGISGSFILLILGMYKFILESITSFNLKVLAFFGVGAVIGVLIISRIIDYLFKSDKSKTLYFLLGLTFGALFKPLYDFREEIVNSNYLLLTGLFFIGILSLIGSEILVRFLKREKKEKIVKKEIIKVKKNNHKEKKKTVKTKSKKVEKKSHKKKIKKKKSKK